MSAGQVTSPNAVIDSTEDPFNPNSFSDVTGRDPETYQVRNDYTEHPGFVGFQLQDRPSISTLRIYNGSDSDDSNDSNIYGTELSVIQTGTPNAAQVKVNPNNGWCQTHIDNLNMYFIAVYDSRGTNNAFDSVEQKVVDSIGTQITDQIDAVLPGEIAAAVAALDIQGTVDDSIDFIGNRYHFANSSGDTEHDLEITTYGRDGTSSVITKQMDTTWAAGTNQGGMQSGSSLPTSGFYYVFVIRNDTTRAIDFIGHTSLSPTIPAGWTRVSARDVFRLCTDSSANHAQFSHDLDGGVVLLTGTLALDLDVSDQGTTRITRTAVNVPGGVVALRRSFSVCGSSHQSKVEATVHTDQAPSISGAALADHWSDSAFASSAFSIGSAPVFINASRQYSTDSTQAGTTLYVQFYGWFWRAA